ncbi:hypothetical protein DFH28DRAFT_889640 [Melampsora americana]|nr:hypothetical protein DFH28DRAFT_889640 [Melampsora americana]
MHTAGSGPDSSQNEQERLSNVQGVENGSESSSGTGEGGLWGSEDGEGSEGKNQETPPLALPSRSAPPLALPSRSAPPLALPGRNVVPLPTRATVPTPVQASPDPILPNPSYSQSTPDRLQSDWIPPPDLFQGFSPSFLNSPSCFPNFSNEQNTTTDYSTQPDIPVPASSYYQSHSSHQDPTFLEADVILPNTTHDIPVPSHTQQEQQQFIDPAVLSSNPTGAGSLTWFHQAPTTQTQSNSVNPVAGSSNDIPVPPLEHYQQGFINPAHLLLDPNGAGSSNRSLHLPTHQQGSNYINPTPGPSYQAEAPIASTSSLPADPTTRKRSRKASASQDGPQPKKARNQPQRDSNNPKLEKTPCTWPGCNAILSKKNMPRHIEGKHHCKKYKCPYCGKKLNWKGDLTRHVKTLHPGEPIPTDVEGSPTPTGPPAPPGPPPPPGGSGVVGF